MPVSRQRKLEIEKRRQQVAELALRGRRQSEIAEQLGVTQATVSVDLKRLRDEWRATARQDVAALIARQLDKLSLVEREAWEAWERSKQPAHTTVVYRGGDNEPSKMRQTLKHPTGDPRYLELLRKCLAAERTLVGLLPAREPDGPDGPDEPNEADETPLPPMFEGIDASKITFAAGLQLMMGHRDYCPSERPPPAPPTAAEIAAQYDRQFADDAERYVSQHGRPRKSSHDDPPPPAT
jgi:DNA-binding CsgD family transcriptional regulator